LAPRAKPSGHDDLKPERLPKAPKRMMTDATRFGELPNESAGERILLQSSTVSAEKWS
jgi:hypothetical protein